MIGSIFVHLASSGVYGLLADRTSDIVRIKACVFVPSDGFVNGRIHDRPGLKDALLTAHAKLEQQSGMRVHTATAVLSSPSYVGDNHFACVPVDNFVTQAHTVQVLDKIHADIDSDKVIIASMHQASYIDGNECKGVLGLSAKSLGANYHVMTMPQNENDDLKRLFEECNMPLDECRFAGLCAAEYVLHDDDKSGVVCVLDIGAQMVSACVYFDGVLIQSFAFAGGAHTVTMDLVADFGIDIAAAETLKTRLATLNTMQAKAHDFYTIGERTLNRQAVRTCIATRYDDILRAVQARLLESNAWGAIKSVVLLGGGAKMNGFVDFARTFFGEQGVVSVSLANVRTQGIALPVGLDGDAQLALAQSLKDSRYFVVLGATLLTSADVSAELVQIQGIWQKIRQWFSFS